MMPESAWEKGEYLDYLDRVAKSIRQDCEKHGYDEFPAAMTVVREVIKPFGLDRAIGLLEMVKLAMLIEDLPEGFWPKPDALVNPTR